MINQNNKEKFPEQIKEKINPIVEIMINIFLFQEKLKIMTDESLLNSNRRKYFIIKKELIDKLKSYFHYDDYFKKINNIFQNYDIKMITMI